jgi:hypothetical protein
VIEAVPGDGPHDVGGEEEVGVRVVEPFARCEERLVRS